QRRGRDRHPEREHQVRARPPERLALTASPMPARLSIHVPGEPILLRIVEDGGTADLGRDPASDIAIAHDSVSRLHARIAQVDGNWLLSDLGSKNGIRVD